MHKDSEFLPDQTRAIPKCMLGVTRRVTFTKTVSGKDIVRNGATYFICEKGKREVIYFPKSDQELDRATCGNCRFRKRD